MQHFGEYNKHKFFVKVFKYQTRLFCVLIYKTLLPRINASPYLFFN